MGLDGRVYCDCIEKGTATVPERLLGLVKIDQDTGCPYLDSTDQDLRRAYSRWQAAKPCPHEGFFLLTRRLGSASSIAGLKALLQDKLHDPEMEIRVLWTKVLYSGVHSGDAVPVKQVAQLEADVKLLRVFSKRDESLRLFLNSLQDLVSAALEVGKPLVF